jgi:pyruvate-formate lyase-activating enzyme
VNITEIYDRINKAKPYVSAVVISGGEPLDQIEATLMIAMYARRLGLKVGLHTSKRSEVATMLHFFDMVLMSDPDVDPRSEML